MTLIGFGCTSGEFDALADFEVHVHYSFVMNI